MILLNGVSGFNGPDSKTDGELFKKICYSIIQELDGNVLIFRAPEVARHYYALKVDVLDQEVYILLNYIYPFVSFASSVEPGNIEFIDQDQLLSKFSPYYRVLTSRELNEPLVKTIRNGKLMLENENELNEAELGLIKYFSSQTVGDVVFNYWD